MPPGVRRQRCDDDGTVALSDPTFSSAANSPGNPWRPSGARAVATAQAVGEAFDLLAPGTPIVVDPVMVAESGARLLDEDAQSALVHLVVARATVVTPNVPEARVLPADVFEAIARDVLPPGHDVRTLLRLAGTRDGIERAPRLEPRYTPTRAPASAPVNVGVMAKQGSQATSLPSP